MHSSTLVLSFISVAAAASVHIESFQAAGTCRSETVEACVAKCAEDNKKPLLNICIENSFVGGENDELSFYDDQCVCKSAEELKSYQDITATPEGKKVTEKNIALRKSDKFECGLPTYTLIHYSSRVFQNTAGEVESAIAVLCADPAEKTKYDSVDLSYEGEVTTTTTTAAPATKTGGYHVGTTTDGYIIITTSAAGYTVAPPVETTTTPCAETKTTTAPCVETTTTDAGYVVSTPVSPPTETTPCAETTPVSPPTETTPAGYAVETPVAPPTETTPCDEETATTTPCEETTPSAPQDVISGSTAGAASFSAAAIAAVAYFAL